jgi:hypothetical protein
MKSKFIFFFVFILCAINVYALGIGPTGNEINYAIGVEVPFYLYVVNKDSAPMDVEISLGGELAEFATVSGGNSFTMDADSQHSFSVIVKLEAGLESGRKDLLVTARQKPKSGPGGSVGATTAVTLVIPTYVPYPEKFLDLRNVEVRRFNKMGEPIQFNVNIASLGSIPIEKITGVMQIINYENKIIDSVKLTSITDLKKQKSATMVATWTPLEDVVLPGAYKAVAVVDFDDNNVSLTRDFPFFIGDAFIDVVNVTPLILPVGRVTSQAMEVLSYWNDNLDFYGEIMLKNNLGETVLGTKTSTETLRAKNSRDIRYYFDTTKIDPGDYVVDVTLYYGEETTNKVFNVELVEDDTEVVSVPVPVVEQTSTQKESGDNTLLYGVIIVLVLVVGYLLGKRNQ